MKTNELFEDAKGPLIWSMIGKILRSGGKVQAYITTWSNDLAKNNPPKFYNITLATLEYDRFQKNESYRLYYEVGGDRLKHWFEVMHSDDSQMKLTKQEDGKHPLYHLVDKSGAPITA